MRRGFISVLAFAVALTPALAHTGVGDTSGFSHGLMHPVGGLDHVLAMVSVGIFAAHCGGRAVWLVPLTFVTAMAAAGAFGMAGVMLPYAEVGIGLSVVALGAIIALRLDPPLVLATALVGFFAIFHGYAHGAEMPESSSGLAYGCGFLVATAMLHAAGIALGLGVAHLGQRRAWRVAQLGGGLITVAGIGILAGVL